MKTDDLLVALAADTTPRATAQGRVLRALPVGFAVSVVALVLIWGIRPDISEALASAAMAKTTAPLLFAALAGAFALALSQPEGAPRYWGLLLLVCVAVALLAFGAALSFGGMSGLFAALWVPSLAVCFLSIPLLALPLMAAILWGISAGASPNPWKTGAVSGVAAGALSTAVYSFYCDQDAVLFYLPAYAAAVLLVALIGGFVGARALKW